MTTTEADHQIALIAACHALTPRVPELAWLVHVPNGEHRHKATAVKLKAMGVQAGVPDLLLFVARGPHCGLALELKRPTRQRERNGGVSDAQARWLDHLEAQGWRSVVAWSAREALTELLTYLGYRPSDFVA